MSELTHEQFENLLKQAVLVHLSDDELGQYHDRATDEVASARIVAHLRQCQMCSGRSALMKLAVATTRESNEQDRASPQDKSAALASFIGLALYALDRQRQRQKIRLSLRGARAAEKLICQGETEDNSLSWQIEEDDFGDVEVALATPRLDLENHRLAIKIGDVVKEEPLERLSERKLGCVFTISREERQQLSDGDPLVIETLKAPLLS